MASDSRQKRPRRRETEIFYLSHFLFTLMTVTKSDEEISKSVIEPGRYVMW